MYGEIGSGEHQSSIDGVHTHTYKVWNDMIHRCNDTKTQRKQPNYKDCTVCDEWLNFQNFAKWYEENYYEIEGHVMCLDKDILIKGNKIYSPETCCIVPHCINDLFVKSNAIRGEYPIGVGLHKHSGRYRAYIKLGTRKVKHIGYYDTISEAFNAYKTYKEDYIKQTADKFKEHLPTKVYEALYNYQVEITD